MSRTVDNLIRLGEGLATHQGVTHWGISMRLFRRGDFLDRLKRKRDILTQTAERAFQTFSDAWPEDLEWPEDIPQPPKTKHRPEVRDAS